MDYTNEESELRKDKLTKKQKNILKIKKVEPKVEIVKVNKGKYVIDHNGKLLLLRKQKLGYLNPILSCSDTALLPQPENAIKR